MVAAGLALREEEIPRTALTAMKRHYAVTEMDLQPHVYMRITDNWLEMSLRFLLPARTARQVKNAMTREILESLDAAGIGIASATYDIVGLPPIQTS